MTLEQIEAHVSQLSPDELKAFNRWFDGFMASAWDRQMDDDAASGRLDRLVAKLGIDFENDATEPMENGWQRRERAGGD